MNNRLLVLALIILAENTNNNLHNINGENKHMKINPTYTEEKINKLINLFHLIPDNYISTINESIEITNTIIKILEKNYLEELILLSNKD